MHWILLFFPLFLFATQSLYLGPDFFFREFKEEIDHGGKSEERGWLYGFQGGYEVIARKVPYVGADLRYAEGTTDYDGAIQNLRTGKLTPFQSQTNNTLFNVEGRVGYPFFHRKWSFIPFLGMGYQRWLREAVERKSGYDEIFTWAYFAEGIRIDWQFKKEGKIGLHLKIMEMKMAEIEISDFLPWCFRLTLGDKVQVEVEMPLSFVKTRYFINATPYYRYLPIGKSQIQTNENGIFFEPASTTQVYGVRIEVGFVF